MKNQPNKATVKGGLPTAHNALSDAYQRHGWLFQPDVLPSGACPHEKIAMEAMQEYSDQQNAELTRQVAALTHQRDFYRKKFNESKGVHIAKDLGIPENIEMAPIVQSDSDALRERVKELEALMQEFVDRVDRGEVRSKKTYAKFKEALK